MFLDRPGADAYNGRDSHLTTAVPGGHTVSKRTQVMDLARWKRRRALGTLWMLLAAATVATLVGCRYMPFSPTYLAEEVRTANTAQDERAALVHVNERSTWQSVRVFDADNLLIPQDNRDRARFVEIEWDDGTLVRRQLVDPNNLDVLFPR